METNIQNCNLELLGQQRQELIDEIINGNNNDYFKIFDLEAGCGKTRTAELAIAEKVKQTSDNVLFVRLNNKDCKESVENINRFLGYDVALDYNNDTIPRYQRGKVQKTFPDLRVLVITHQRYRELAKNRSQRKIFTEGRNTLVVDEFLSDMRKLELSVDDIKSYKVFFERNNVMYELFLKISAGLEDYFSHADMPDKEFTIITKEDIKKNISSLLKYVKHNLNDNDVEERKIILSNDEKICTITQLCSHVEDLREFYGKPCYVRAGVFYTTDSKCKSLLLDNNILLDASGELQIAYNINQKLYMLKSFPKVLDHSNWTLNNVIVNTTASGKKRVQNFYEVVNSAITKYGSDETLVVGSQNDLPFFNCKHKAYFGNLTGSNEWAGLKNVIIAQTPNIDDVDYILQYLHYSSDYVLETFGKASTKSTGRNMTSRYQFTDPRFEEIRCLWIAEQTYQALKRVNRNMGDATTAVVFMNNPDVIDLLKSQLAGCKVVTTTEDKFRFVPTKQESYIEELQKNSFATRFTNLLAEFQYGKHQELLHKDKNGSISKGKYSKKTVREYLGIKSAKDFNNKVLSKTQVVTYCKVRGIEIAGQFIKLPDNLNITA